MRVDVGELAALCTAVSWSGSSLAFAVSSRRVGGLAVNQFRLLLALPLLAALVAFGGGDVLARDVPAWRLQRLLWSGVVGLVLGDACYFHALTWLGPRLASVLQASWPAMATLLALAAAGEVPAAGVLLGIALTSAGVVAVLLRPGRGAAWNPQATARQRRLAVVTALLGAFGQALAMVLARPALRPGPDLPLGVPPLSGTMLRMAAALPAIVLLAAAQRRPLAALAVLRDPVALRVAVLGTAFGPVLGVWLSMAAMRHAGDTGSAAALMATTPLFLMLVARVVHGVRIGWLGAAGTALAVAGAAVLLASQAGHD